MGLNSVCLYSSAKQGPQTKKIVHLIHSLFKLTLLSFDGVTSPVRLWQFVTITLAPEQHSTEAFPLQPLKAWAPEKGKKNIFYLVVQLCCIFHFHGYFRAENFLTFCNTSILLYLKQQ